MLHINFNLFVQMADDYVKYATTICTKILSDLQLNIQEKYKCSKFQRLIQISLTFVKFHTFVPFPTLRSLTLAQVTLDRFPNGEKQNSIITSMIC